jgi:predicted phosphoribosyltransferase
MPTLFRDRRHAGQVLAEKLARYADLPEVIVLALPRGGVPVAFEVANVLHAPLDVFLVRKLGMPGHEEFAMGAIASGGIRVMNPEIQERGISSSVIDRVAAREQQELERREAIYRGDQPHRDLTGRTVILIDDGLATGASMQAAVAALRKKQPQRVVVATPIGAPDSCEAFKDLVDEVVCVMTPDPFYAVGMWYEHFGQTTDEEVCHLLRLAAARPARSAQGQAA